MFICVEPVFRKSGSKFVVQLPEIGKAGKIGEVISVKKKDGSVSKVKLTKKLKPNKYGDILYEFVGIKEEEEVVEPQFLSVRDEDEDYESEEEKAEREDRYSSRAGVND